MTRLVAVLISILALAEQEVSDISRNFNSIKVAGCSGNQNQTWDYYFLEP